MLDPGPPTSPTLLRQLFHPEEGPQAWVTFLERYEPYLTARCRRLGLQHVDAEDVTACVLAKLARALRDFAYDPRRHFRAWLQTVIRHAVADFRDAQRRRPVITNASGDGFRDIDQLADPWTIDALTEELGEGLEVDLLRAEQISQRVRERVAPQTWEAFRLTELEGLSAAEAAQRLGMKVTALYVARRRVVQMLRETGAEMARENPQRAQRAREPNETDRAGSKPLEQG